MSKREPIDLRHMSMPRNLAWHRTQKEAAKTATANLYRQADVKYIWWPFQAGWYVGYNIEAGFLRLLCDDASWVDVPWMPDLYTRRIQS